MLITENNPYFKQILNCEVSLDCGARTSAWLLIGEELLFGDTHVEILETYFDDLLPKCNVNLIDDYVKQNNIPLVYSAYFSKDDIFYNYFLETTGIPYENEDFYITIPYIPLRKTDIEIELAIKSYGLSIWCVDTL